MLCEAATSLYQDGIERAYERSSSAHNVLQLGCTSSDGSIHWIEPVQVWGSFRAGRKPSPKHRSFGSLPDGGCYVQGCHDGFENHGAQHFRRLELTHVGPLGLRLSLIDTVYSSKLIHFRLWLHLAPQLPHEFLQRLHTEAPSAKSLSSNWHTTWFSQGFGRRLPRESYCISGILPPGHHRLRNVLFISSSCLPFSE